MPNPRNYNTFKSTMSDLIFWARAELKKKLLVLPLNEVQHAVCLEIAKRFKLWTGEGTYPRWLSRIVSGIEADHATGREED